MSWHGDVHIIHKMADGRILESVKGITVPFNETTEGVYRMIARNAIERAQEEKKRESETA